MQFANELCQILVAIRKQQVINDDGEIERRTEEINKLKDSARMFQAVRELTSHKPKALVVKNAAGETIGQEEVAAKAVAEYFLNLFYLPSFFTNLKASVPTNKKLNSSINTDKTEKTVLKR